MAGHLELEVHMALGWQVGAVNRSKVLLGASALTAELSLWTPAGLFFKLQEDPTSREPRGLG